MKRPHCFVTLMLLGTFLLFFPTYHAIGVSDDLTQLENLVTERKLGEAQQKLSILGKKNHGPEEKSFLLFQKARIRYIEKDYAGTIPILDDITANYAGTSKSPNARYLKACAFLQLKDEPNAKAAFKEFIDNYPDHACAPDAALRYAYLTLREGEIPANEIAPLFKQVFEKYPDTREAADAALRYARITYIMSDKTQKEKKAAFEAVVNSYPDTPEAYEAKKSVAALSWLESEQEKSLEKKYQVEQIYMALEDNAKTEADKGFAAMHLAALNLEIERLLKEDDGRYSINYDLVKTLCDKALEIAPEGEKETRATASLIKSECVYYSDTWENAIKSFQDMLKKYSREEKCRTQCAFAQYMLATVYSRKKDYENAEKAYEKLLTDYSDAPNFKHNNIQATSGLHLGQMMSDQGRYDEAIEQLQKVNQMYPKTREARIAANMMALVDSAKKGGMK